MKFTVIEIQNGIVGANVWAYDDQNAAESKYHAILSSAAVSQVAVHAAVLVSEEGFPLMHGCYKHG
ncbi:MAG: hypothetical protein IKD61_05955 [Oscillospiraceae bacterium]|nr:hypothetical protein [Oscillospiraceae bacterium]MBR6352687.1 hypothetical protein [Oscillospiraceae bacterium]